MNAAAMIGIPAIADVSSLKLPLRPIMDQLPRVIYEGVIFLAMDIRNWDFAGHSAGFAEAKAWIGEGTDSLRRRRIEQLLDIFERPADRFMAINLNSGRTTFSDIASQFEASNERTTVLLDAFALANDVKLAQPGGLFSLNVNEA